VGLIVVVVVVVDVVVDVDLDALAIGFRTGTILAQRRKDAKGNKGIDVLERARARYPCARMHTAFRDPRKR